MNSSGKATCRTQKVAYKVRLLYSQPKANHSGSTVRVKLQLLNATGINLSAFRIKATGYPAGTYRLSFTASGDPTVHTAKFVISRRGHHHRRW